LDLFVVDGSRDAVLPPRSLSEMNYDQATGSYPIERPQFRVVS